MKKKLKDEFKQQLQIMSTQAVMRSQMIADKLKINPTDLESIEVLYREGKTTAGKLAEYTGLTTGAITGVIDRLVHAGFAMREPDPEDRRKVFVTLDMKKITEEVVPLYDSISGSVDKLLEGYSEPELNIIIDFLKKVNLLSQKDLEQFRNI
jgi:DNA-binding MarR family transcriptional regulator